MKTTPTYTGLGSVFYLRRNIVYLYNNWQNEGMEIAALVSGGVDSSVVVHQLKEAGYEPVIFYIRIGMEDKEGYIACPSEEDVEITSYVARKYGCRFEQV
ncbi:MAG: hypothetical protein LBQ68_05710, partial [Clostridiales bacterium]|nr:hypothetical protein [Clostridiales bacterium]